MNTSTRNTRVGDAIASFASIGSDRYLRLTDACASPDRFAHRAWDLYDREFGCFTGAKRDSSFCRLDHPATQVGRIVLPPDCAVLVVGTGPSLGAHRDALRRLRDAFYVVTSFRGAAALADLGVTPDLVLLSATSPLDAVVTLQLHRASGVASPLNRESIVAADERTPNALINDVPADRLIVPACCPSWSWWTPAAVAMALDGGSRVVALLGADAGSAGGASPAFEPMVSLLELLATVPEAQFFDCGGAPKRGWLRSSLDGAPRRGATVGVEIERRPRPTLAERWAEERRALDRLTADLAWVRETYEDLCGRPDGAWRSESLDLVCDDMIQWREQPVRRRMLQEDLGLQFLPTFWRLGISCGDERRIGAARLALGELFLQCDRLDTKLEAIRHWE